MPSLFGVPPLSRWHRCRTTCRVGLANLVRPIGGQSWPLERFMACLVATRQGGAALVETGGRVQRRCLGMSCEERGSAEAP